MPVRWIKKAGWLAASLPGRLPNSPQKQRIERIAHEFEQLGSQPLAAEYGEPNGQRTPNDVRSSGDCGDFYSWIVRARRPSTVVEFGSGFGVSGMYFCAGLEANQLGHLYSFEINPIWAEIATRSIARISPRFALEIGAFEDRVADVVKSPIDIAFVDGIHTREFVLRQFEVLMPLMAPDGIVLFDDIDFPSSAARMYDAWEEIAADTRVVGALEIRGHLGVVSLA